MLYFNKTEKIKQPPMDKDALLNKLQERLERLKARFDMFNNFA